MAETLRAASRAARAANVGCLDRIPPYLSCQPWFHSHSPWITYPYAVPRLARLSRRLCFTLVDMPVASSIPGERIILRLFLMVRIVAWCEGTGDTLRSISGGTFSVSVFSAGKAIRGPLLTPPSQDKKQARIAPQIRMIPARNVGRRYRNFWNRATRVSDRDR